jgi:uncharacterized protein
MSNCRPAAPKTVARPLGGRTRYAAAGGKHIERVPSDLPRRMLLALVRGYRLLFSAWLGNVCRYEPTCSAYALQALERHGSAAGSYLAMRRVLRCHPWCAGGCDTVPEQPPSFFRSLQPALKPTPSSTHKK